MQHLQSSWHAPCSSSVSKQQLGCLPVWRACTPVLQSRGRQRQRCNASSADPPPPNRNGKPQMSRLEAFMRNTPGLNRFVDGTLIAGDIVMVLATQASSNRLSWAEMPYFAAVAILSWVPAAALCGDYMMARDPDDNPLSNAMGWPVVRAIVAACITWAVATVPAIWGYSFLVSHWMVEADHVLDVARDGQLAPQLEVVVALLVTMCSWRGMAARLRSGADV